MILQSLNELYDRLKTDPDYQIAPPGYSIQKISFKVVLKPNGELFGIQPVRVTSGKNVRPRLETVPGTAKPPGQGLNPCLLWDNTGYMLGFKPDDPKPNRTLKAFGSFKEKHLELEREIDCASFSVVCRFLENWDPASANEHEVLKETSTGFGVFQIQGQTQLVHEDPDVRGWWENSRAKEPPGDEAQCLVTGTIAPIAPTHPKIKGVKGAQSSGASIVSFNEDAYESYGKNQSLNSPISKVAAFQYAKALNALLDSPRHRLSLGEATAVFWTAKPTLTESVFARFFSEGSNALDQDEAQDESVREKLAVFLKALRTGRPAYEALEPDPDRTPFFLLGLSPNAARLSIRFFYSNFIGQLLDNLRQHHLDIGITPQPSVGKRRADLEFPPAWMLLAETARETKEIPPILEGPLLRAIIIGAQYPVGLFQAVLRRIRADRTMNYARACVIKGYLTRNLKKEVSMSLDLEREDVGYLLGRLFSTLEKTQGDALGSVNASIRDRFYSSASATPRSVFPRLLRTYQHHLAKLEGGRKVNREKLLQEIVDPIKDFPAQLDLADQGLFAIGYYHQTRDFYTKKEGTAE